MLAPRKTLRRSGLPQRAGNVGLPAPNMGVVAQAAYSVGDQLQSAALYMYNLIPGEYGCRVRPGSREFATLLRDANGELDDVRTLMFYNSLIQGGANDRFFATTNKGIYDMTGGSWNANGRWTSSGNNPPLAGEFSSSLTELRVNKLDNLGALIDLTDLVVDGRVIIAEEATGGITYDVTGAPVDQGDWWEIPVTSIVGNPFPPDLDARIDFQSPPELVFEWPVQDDTAGWCSVVNYTNTGGDHFLLVCDESNGYYIFDGTDWTQGTFTGQPQPNPEDLVQVTEWGGNICFVERNTATIWYLDPLAISGDIADFNVGSLFIEGGHLAQLASWSVDAGDGMDDKLVAISGSGDVLVYQGQFGQSVGLAGRWQVGTVPEGRRIMSDFGGDVLILTQNGIVRLSELVSGLITEDPTKYTTSNIGYFVRREMEQNVGLYGWQIAKSTKNGIVVVSVPRSDLQASQPYVQFVMDINTQAWTMFRNLNMRCMKEAEGEFYFGTDDGRVMLMTGTVDNGTLAGLSSVGIEFSLLTHYTSLGAPANWKQVQFVRPWWLGDADPAYLTKTFYDFNLGSIESSPIFTGVGVALWDAALWDLDEWAVTAQNYWETIGSKNMGRHVALAIKGETAVNTTYLGCDLMVTQGGPL